MPSLSTIWASFWDKYQQETPRKVKMIDVFLVYALLTGVIQFVYRVLVGTFPYNSFLSGFGCAVGAFVFAVSLRLQITSDEFATRSPLRAFGDFAFCNVLLFIAAMNFMG